MRQFSVEYLEATRAGMWEESREALADLDLPGRNRILDVGAGTGEFTRILREETTAQVVAMDADTELLAHVDAPRVAGDATRLPFGDGSFDLVVCQALLVNLPDPSEALREFVRVSSDRVAVVEPANDEVTIESTVDDEPALARCARELYLEGVATDAALGDASELLETAGLESVTVRRHDHVQTVEPPYSEQALESARRKATGAGIESDRETLLESGLSPDSFDALRQNWRAMGRDVVEQMREKRYQQREVVPFYVTTGRVPNAEMM